LLITRMQKPVLSPLPRRLTMSRPFRFGVTAGYAPSRAAWTSIARQAEELGYGTLLIPDRTSVGILAPIPALAIAASATSSLRVGSFVFCNGYRHPVLLAREAGTLDLLTDGRFELGLGAGVSPAESEQMGIPFAGAGARVGQLAEAIQVMKQLFTNETVEFHGTYYTISGLKGTIKPAQKPHMPILVAGAGEKMLKLAAREADIVAIGSTRGGDPSEATLDQKISWIKEAAGDRFDHLELSQTIYDLDITDSATPPSPQQGGWFVPRRPLSVEQAVALLLEERDRYGISYLQIQLSQMHNFAPVVAELAGK
jgi:probable F420-dependent oxidoreductase